MSEVTEPDDDPSRVTLGVAVRISLVMAALIGAMFAIGWGEDPLLVMPGSTLRGPIEPAPDDWSFAGDQGTLQLETRAEAPYSVNVAYTVIDGRLYVNAGDTQTEWVKRLTANPNVRVRIDGVVYEPFAERVTERETIERFGEAWTAQSFWRRNPAKLDGEVWLYHLYRY